MALGEAIEMSKTSRFFLELAVLLLAMLALPGTAAIADTSTGTSGQPNQSCQAVFPTGPLSPAGFNTAGFANAESVYAGSGQNTQTPANSNAVAQYDVACFQVAQH